MSHSPFNVLFLCTRNAARSIMAETLVDHLGEDRFKGHSAGSFPVGEVHPMTLALLREQGLLREGLRPKSWDEFAQPDAPAMDFIFTLCDEAAGEVCPVWPGHPVNAHWGIPNPAMAEGGEVERMLAFRDAFRMLERRLRLFVALPVQALDRMALTQQVEAIGRMRGDTAEGLAS